jgi:hypothetical protein
VRSLIFFHRLLRFSARKQAEIYNSRAQAGCCRGACSLGEQPDRILVRPAFIGFFEFQRGPPRAGREAKAAFCVAGGKME